MAKTKIHRKAMGSEHCSMSSELTRYGASYMASAAIHQVIASPFMVAMCRENVKSDLIE